MPAWPGCEIRAVIQRVIGQIRAIVQRDDQAKIMRRRLMQNHVQPREIRHVGDDSAAGAVEQGVVPQEDAQGVETRIVQQCGQSGD